MDVWTPGSDLSSRTVDGPAGLNSTQHRAVCVCPLCSSHLSPSRAGEKCFIHLDLSIATILITPECCQPAGPGGVGGGIDSLRLID